MAAAAHNPRNAFDPLILQKWAGYAHPERIVPTAYLSHTENTVAILDKFPKAIFHVLILPRIRDGLTKEDLKNLRALLGSRSKVSLERAKQLLEAMGEHARMVRDEIQRDMRQRYKFEWDVWIGFHAVPSMEHLHLHVISSDLHSEKMKTKKHYNSFHPTHGFFLHYDDVMSWFDAVPSFFKDKISGLKATQYMDILKERLSCFQCTQTFSNMPQLKAHLEMHHTTQYNAALRMYERERKAASKPSSKASSTGLPKKRQHDGKPISIASGSSRTSGSH